jgi:hypothetical protein
MHKKVLVHTFLIPVAKGNDLLGILYCHLGPNCKNSTSTKFIVRSYTMELTFSVNLVKSCRGSLYNPFKDKILKFNITKAKNFL